MTWTCEQVLRDIKLHDLDCDPRVFHVLFVALTEPESDIAREVRRLEANETALTVRDLEFLYDAYINSGIEPGHHMSVVQSSQARTSSISTSANTAMDLSKHLATCAQAQSEKTPLRDTVLQINSEMQENLTNITAQAEVLEAELQAYQAELFTDALTGVPNRRFLEAELPARLNVADLSLHIALIDVDHFKQINDLHGHVLGDYAIRIVANLIQNHLRPQDVMCRYGGEEFCILFYNTDAAVCLEMLEGIRTDIARRTIYHNRTGKSFGPLTVSAGLARTQPGDDFEAAVQRADELMYQSKTTGRNRISS
ncbi:GGDEF domain-containing protein [Labrenzia sp. PHM005]|uniref:GGDEF domain-containing protein n=1 Tax=Labrenzia sp. PHM005 TaxID=2590016 RepID=UPI0011404A1F|nr:GGDEF domain-containing protein [Labrenzia sp. PHM005]QDG76569.1 GGDEF domain-containing protein [Labrenzia sp. PHM005]